MTSNPFLDAAHEYLAKGWTVVPVFPGGAVPKGSIGRVRTISEFMRMPAWIDRVFADATCIALAHDPRTVGLDLDEPDELPALEAAHGALPPTYYVSNRGADSPRRTPVYRLPFRVAPLNSPSELAPGVEVKDWSHGHQTVWPSVHRKDPSRHYQWYDPQGRPCGVPYVDDLTELPEAWVRVLDSRKPKRSEHATPPNLEDPDPLDDRVKVLTLEQAQLLLERSREAAFDVDSGNAFRTGAPFVWAKDLWRTAWLLVEAGDLPEQETGPWVAEQFGRHPNYGTRWAGLDDADEAMLWQAQDAALADDWWWVLARTPEPAVDAPQAPASFMQWLGGQCMDLTVPYEPLPRRKWWATHGGVTLLHESSIVLLYGDPGSLKSMLAQHIALEAARAGDKVAYLDFENARSTQGRLVRMAAGDLPATLWLLPMDGMPSARLVEGLAAERFDLVVFDSATYLEALAGEGRGDGGAGPWVRICLEILNPLRRSGATVVVIDHLPKAADGKASSPTGSVQKRGQADQMFLLRAKPGRFGVVTIARAKDREGEVTRDLQVPELVPFLEMSMAEDLFGEVAVAFRDLEGDERRDAELRVNEDKMLAAYEEVKDLERDKALGLKEVYDLAGLSRQKGRTAWDRLVAKGRVPKLSTGKAEPSSLTVG